MARRPSKRDRISLPWEGRSGRWRGVLRSTSLQAVLGSALAVVLLVGLFRYTEGRIRARDTRVAIGHVEQAIDRFRAEVGRCPRSNAELLHPPLSQKHYLDSLPSDGWGRPLHIRCPGYFDDQADVISAGPSGSLLKDDNIQ